MKKVAVFQEIYVYKGQINITDIGIYVFGGNTNIFLIFTYGK